MNAVSRFLLAVLAIAGILALIDLAAGTNILQTLYDVFIGFLRDIWGDIFG